jgi:hypothetical protein
MDGARDAVLQLEVHLGNSVLWEDGGIRDITWIGQLDVGIIGVSNILQSHALADVFSNLKAGVGGYPEGDVRIAADSTMLRMVNLLIALSFGVQREQLEQRIGLTWPRPFLLRPL